jgi:ATP-dependent RNA helicase SUPV3L1/SUV3
LTPPRPRRWSARNVTAVLGPTNTGKTHLAIERMLGHETGIIGLPLRLLAREVYGRVAARVGESQVALVTGEEKIVPAQPRYWVSTVEAMPRETDAAFVAIDEVQIAGDLERGHVFTDRLLNLRGGQETLLLGAATMRGIIEQLLPGVHVVTRPRMSVLAYAGQKKITRLPERSAVVTFAANDVYAIAELIRRQRGGAAVVLGALSPRTRNKQVEIYQSGDVDFIVATDAIGMGLNLDVDHVAFASNTKFDGYQFRPLTAAELGQVAGRAGRHMRDGTFGVTARVAPFEDALVEALETHRFEPLRTLQWRSDALDFGSISALKASLDRPPDVEGLTKAPPADDQTALETLSRDDEVTDRVNGPADVRRLWDVCRLPDYRKIAPAQHAQLVATIFKHLMDDGAVPDDWMAAQIRHANRIEGDIDTLSNRIAHVRTWTFVANQPDWLRDPAAWREEARAVEDALSDALHEKLTKRFVDRRTSVLMRRLRENAMLDAEITASGDVLVEGQHVGALQGFRFTPDAQAEGADAKAVRAAAGKALAGALAERAERLSRASDKEIVLSSDDYLRWAGEPVARLAPGDDPLRPRLVLLADEQLSGPPRELAETRLTAWLKGHIGTLLKPLVDLDADAGLAGMARGIAFRMKENFGILDRRAVAQEVRDLDQGARASLRRHGVRFGAYHVYVPALLKPGPSALLAQLWALTEGGREIAGISELAAVSSSGRTSVNVDPAIDREVYRRFGFRIYGQRAIRIDILERLADLIRPALAWRPGAEGAPPPGAAPGGFTVTPAMTSLLGASGEDLAAILKGLGYRSQRRSVAPEGIAQPSAAPSGIPPAAPMNAAPEAEEAAAVLRDDEAPPVEPPAVDAEQAEPVPEMLPSPAEAPPAGALSGEGAELRSAESTDEDAVMTPELVDAEESVGRRARAESVAAESGAEPAAALDGGEPASAAPPEPAMIEVWQPAPSPRRAKRGAPDRNAAADHGKGEAVRKGRPRPPRQARESRDGREGREPALGRRESREAAPDARPHGSRPESRPPRPREKPIDPDNPFAALAALRQELVNRGRR